MIAEPLVVYVLCVFLLFGKFAAAIVVQAKERLRTRVFRYEEDARRWGGKVGEDSELCQRAQNLLRNDSESQPFFLAIGGAYVASGAWPQGATLYFGVYTVSRLAHAYWFLAPRQPHRNRAFAVGLITLLSAAGHVMWQVAS